MSGSLTVHIRVNDARTGQPTPVRLRIVGPQDETYVPFGRSVDFPTGRGELVGGHLWFQQKKFTYIDGSCEIHLPTATPLTVEISRGPLDPPIRESVVLGSGQMALRFTIPDERPHSFSDWMSLDTRAHFLTPDAALLERQAEGLDFVNVLLTPCEYASPDGHLYSIVKDLETFSGQKERLSGVAVNTFNTHPALGRLALLHSHRAVFPLTFGSLDSSDDWSLCDWADQCHRKKGLVIWTDAFRPEHGLLGGEALVAAILGKVDGIELDARERSTPFLPWWYRLLNAGIRLPIVGGSGKDSNRTPLGLMRTYLPCPVQPDDSHAWVEAIRAGKSVASNGPLIRLTANDRGPGSSLDLSSHSMLSIHAEAWSRKPFDRLELVWNGQVIAEAGQTSDGSARLEIERVAMEPGWLAARCISSSADGGFAHTSPLFCAAANRNYRDRSAIDRLQSCLDQVADWFTHHARYTQNRWQAYHAKLVEDARHTLAEKNRREGIG